jgi:hypothetical protein
MKEQGHIAMHTLWQDFMDWTSFVAQRFSRGYQADDETVNTVDLDLGMLAFDMERPFLGGNYDVEKQTGRLNNANQQRAGRPPSMRTCATMIVPLSH